jgi:hypothetical protein
MMRTLRMGASEVCIFMGIVGQDFEAELTPSGYGVQLYRNGRAFSGPNTRGEAGWGMVGFDHTLTLWDAEGRWHPLPQPTEVAA